MKSGLVVVVVLAIAAVGVWSIPSGYLNDQLGTPGIKHVQNDNSEFVAGESEDALTENRNEESLTEPDHLSNIDDSEDSVSLTRTESGVEVEEAEAVNDEQSVDGSISTIDDTREPREVSEDTPVYGFTEVKRAEEEVKVAETPDEEDNTSVNDESTLVVEEPTPVVRDIQDSVVPVGNVARAVEPTGKSRVVPQRKKVYVQEDEESVEYVQARDSQVAEEEEESGFPLGGTFFPINFGDSTGATGAVAIANSFSTGKGGSLSQAVAYGSRKEALRD